MDTSNVFKVFISSARDTTPERKICIEAIDEINRVIRDHVKIRLEVIRWEDLTPLTPNLREETIQDVINRHVDKCDAFILILNKRIGTVVPPRTMTNLEIEIERALHRLLTERKIHFLTYFKNISPNDDLGEQEKKVLKLREKLDKKGVFHYSYDDPDEFKSKSKDHLYEIILRYRFSTSKVAALRKFWNLGVNDRDNNEIAIIYPPVSIGYVSTHRKVPYWQDRLVPHVVFEDFKALQKIEKSLRMIEYKNYRFFDTKHIPSNINNINRVWLCLPRNVVGLEQLEKYHDVRKFEFYEQHQELFITWQSGDGNSGFAIESPLKYYLKYQRPDHPQEWDASLSKVIAKDYAVLSRFAVRDPEITHSECDLKEYFIAGLRGLGTWGAGWFIDRMYPLFNALNPNDDIQILLEVEFQNNRIHRVKDVSYEPESYFKEQNSEEMILHTISTYRRNNGI